jgi:hypothetical protein
MTINIPLTCASKDENTNYGHGQQSIEKIKQNEQH